MKNYAKKSLKSSNGITLIALVVTIIVLLILAGISISMLSGNNSILQKAGEAKEKTERATIIENAQTDILGQIAENKGRDITKVQLANILNKYFLSIDAALIPDEISSTNDLELTTQDEKYKIYLSQIYNTTFEIEPAKWIYTHDTQTVAKGTLTLNIGDYINYTAPIESGYDSKNKWRVLGAENGQLLLVSESNVTSSQTLQRSSGPEQWLSVLNDVGEKCADNIKTENGRCLTVEDINKITGYNPLNTGVNDPELTGTGIPYSDRKLDQYGNKVTFSLKNGKVWYQGDLANTTETQSTYTTFKLIGKTNDISEPYTIENTYYQYYPGTLTSNSSGEKVGIPTGNTSAIWNMLFYNTMNNEAPYYLASVYGVASNGYDGSKSPPVSLKGTANWSLRAVRNQMVYTFGILWDSRGNSTVNPTVKERAVVSLKSDITPVLSSTDEATGVSTYDI